MTMFFIFVFGLMFVFRILSDLRKNLDLQLKTLTKIGTGYLLYLIIVARAFQNTSFIFTCLVFAPVFLFQLSKPLIVQIRYHSLRRKIPTFLSQVLLKMGAGVSFRVALHQAIEDQSDLFFRKTLKSLYENVVFSQQEPKNLKKAFGEVMREFRLIHQNPHSGRSRLQNFRRKLLVESDFRRRSGQVLLQIRMQALILSGIYFALCGFVIHRYGFEKVQTILTHSAAVFSIGLFLVFRLGRRIRWKL